MPLLASAVGCSKEDIVPAAESATRFTLRVCPEATQAITRAADERAVEDINVFLFDPQGIRPSQHFYVQGGVLERSIPAGRYDVYAVANLHEDMGPMSRKTLSAYEFRVPRSYTSLPMSGYAECTVGKGMPEATVTVRRNVAKIVCNISFYGVDYDLKLQSVQVMDMAGVTTLFAEDQQARELTSSELSAIASYENRKASRTFFLAENCRGEVPGITSQEQKCAGNAPEGATFLRIKAQREGKLLTYDVYLGENNTTNFDVRRNTVYTLNIVIKGENVVDTRVDAFEVGISDNFLTRAIGSRAIVCTTPAGSLRSPWTIRKGRRPFGDGSLRRRKERGLLLQRAAAHLVRHLPARRPFGRLQFLRGLLPRRLLYRRQSLPRL
ncbi:MAG: hypothetical protein ACLRZL_10780 [Alistipes communis]